MWLVAGWVGWLAGWLLTTYKRTIRTRMWHIYPVYTQFDCYTASQAQALRLHHHVSAWRLDRAQNGPGETRQRFPSCLRKPLPFLLVSRLVLLDSVFKSTREFTQQAKCPMSLTYLLLTCMGGEKRGVSDYANPWVLLCNMIRTNLVR